MRSCIECELELREKIAWKYFAIWKIYSYCKIQLKHDLNILQKEPNKD